MVAHFRVYMRVFLTSPQQQPERRLTNADYQRVIELL